MNPPFSTNRTEAAPRKEHYERCCLARPHNLINLALNAALTPAAITRYCLPSDSKYRGVNGARLSGPASKSTMQPSQTNSRAK